LNILINLMAMVLVAVVGITISCNWISCIVIQSPLFIHAIDYPIPKWTEWLPFSSTNLRPIEIPMVSGANPEDG
jgi:hypothetical protein